MVPKTKLSLRVLMPPPTAVKKSVLALYGENTPDLSDLVRSKNIGNHML
jgi:hypothetical protein